MKLAFVLFFVAVLLNACSTTNSARVYETPRATSKNIGSYPDIGSERTIDVGQIIYTEFEYDTYVDTILRDKFADRRLMGSVEVPADVLLRGVTAPDGTFQFCSTENYYKDPITGPYDIVCFGDFDNDFLFEQFRVPAISMGKWKQIEIPVRYERVLIDDKVDKGRGFKYELIFQGLDEGDIKISYREYVDNMARPAFTQVVEYEVDDKNETEIAFKGARVSVTEVTSNYLTYRVTKGFTK